jgi:hypothetical protein
MGAAPTRYDAFLDILHDFKHVHQNAKPCALTFSPQLCCLRCTVQRRQPLQRGGTGGNRCCASCDISMVTERVKKLFRGHPKLIRDFNYFLPQEHKIQQVSHRSSAHIHATDTLSGTRARAQTRRSQPHHCTRARRSLRPGTCTARQAARPCQCYGLWASLAVGHVGGSGAARLCSGASARWKPLRTVGSCPVRRLESLGAVAGVYRDALS